MLETFLNREDAVETWADIYRSGGEPLLRDWSKYAFSKGWGWCEDKGMEYHHGLRLYLTFNHIEADDDEVLKFIHLIPQNCHPHCIDNPNAGVKLISALWVGTYHDADGDLMPDAVPMTAFLSHYHEALYIFRTRPDLAATLEPDMKRLYTYCVEKDFPSK